MSYSSEVLADSPLVYWRFGDGSGTTAADSSGNSRAATWDLAPTYVSGLLVGDANGAIKPTAHIASIADAAWMDVSALTVEAWVNYDTLVASSGIVDRYDNGGGGVSSFLLWTPGNKFSFAIRDNAGDKSATDTATIATGTTYHVVGTCDGSNVKLYVNGSLVATTACGSLAAGSAAIVTGVTVFNSGGALGTIDEVAVYGSALSSGRVSAHYAAGSSSGGATVSPPAATATATARVPVVSATSTVTPPAAGASALALPPTIGAGGNATVSPPAATATATARPPVFTQVIPAGTDTSNSLNGRRRRARASVVVTRPAAVTPSRAAVKYDKSVPYPPPTLVNGRPT